MKTIHFTSALLVMSIFICKADEDQKITLDQAPSAVQKSAKDHAGTSEIVRVEKANEGGQIQYEVLTKKADGSKIEYILMPDGSLDSTEEKLGKDALPDAIAGTVKTAVGDGQIKGVEKVTKGDAVTYEVGYKNSKGAEMEAVVSSEGKLIKNGVDAD